MKLALEGQQQEHYRRHGALEVEGLVTQRQVQELNSAIATALSRRLALAADAVEQQPEAALFMAGRDLWRDSEAMRKFICSPRLAHIAHELTNAKALRVGCDQLFECTTQASLVAREDPQFSKLLEKPRALDEVLCVQGIVTGILIRLSPAEGPSLPHIPQQSGNVVFLSPQVLFNIESLYRNKGQRFLLIVYAEERAQYVLRDIDPHTHALKKIGYGFGDRLNQQNNPLVFR